MSLNLLEDDKPREDLQLHAAQPVQMNIGPFPTSRSLTPDDDDSPTILNLGGAPTSQLQLSV